MCLTFTPLKASQNSYSQILHKPSTRKGQVPNLADFIFLQVHFYGDDAEVDLTNAQDKVYAVWNWIPMKDLSKNVIAEKRTMYEQVRYFIEHLC